MFHRLIPSPDGNGYEADCGGSFRGEVGEIAAWTAKDLIFAKPGQLINLCSRCDEIEREDQEIHKAIERAKNHVEVKITKCQRCGGFLEYDFSEWQWKCINCGRVAARGMPSSPV